MCLGCYGPVTKEPYMDQTPWQRVESCSGYFYKIAHNHVDVAALRDLSDDDVKAVCEYLFHILRLLVADHRATVEIRKSFTSPDRIVTPLERNAVELADLLYPLISAAEGAEPK